ncbi:unnamed protein product [Oikopleura dioica]|uniref:Chromodomain-helicase-DNA-binding protein 6-9 tri-helical domain-containing protein n=1 Tax=Oikopleura dioica TaxID=34765 RepID=E4YTC4_OIKDI|nr:unnamed protein product [Oikopleura dioica]
MFDRASLKLGLDRAVLQSMSGTSGKDAGGPMSSLSKKEVEDLLKKGAYGALMDDDDAAEKFCEEDIDQILAKRATTIKHDGGVKGSTFSKATFAGAADNRMDIDINDPDFWEKWARKADLDLDALTSNKLIIEQPRVRKQTQRYNPEFDETAHIEGMEGSDSDSDGAPGKKRRNVGWGRKESFKLQKGLLMFGWGRWQDISEHCQLSKSFPEKEIEEVARAVLSLAASCYNGDDKVKQFIWELITPPEFAHELHLHSALPQRQPTKKSKRGRDSESPPPLDEGREWVIQLDGLLVDDQFRKHVVTHANKLLGRVRVLSYLRTEILADWLDHIKDNVPSTEYELDVPNIEGDPPVPWWDEEADKSLLVGIFKHGYDRYSLIRNDPSLVFVKKVGPADDKALMADLMEASASTQNNAEAGNVETELSANSPEVCEETKNDQGDSAVKEENLQENEKAESLSTPQLKYEPWPGIPDLNKRFRMIVAAYQRIFRRAAARAQRMNKNRVQRQINERWTKREESDFYRAVSTFGTEMLPNGTFNWEKFRMVAKLDKKTDTSLTNYYIAFRAMCERTCRRTTIPDEDLPAVYVEQISEDRASRTLMRIQLLDRIRRECLIHPQLDARLKLCQKSPDLPIWWKAGSHDKELLVGLHKHGLSRGEIHILNDTELSFGDVMSSAQKIAPKIVVKTKEEPAEINEESTAEKIEEKDENNEKTIEIQCSPKPSSPVDATEPSDEKIEESKPEDSKKDDTTEEAKLESEEPNEQEVKSEDLKEQDVIAKEKVKEEEAVPEGPVVEVATEEEKQLLEAEFIQQQALNRCSNNHSGVKARPKQDLRRILTRWTLVSGPDKIDSEASY